MDEVSDFHVVLRIEAVLNEYVFHAELAEAVADVDLSTPLSVGDFGAYPDVRNRNAVGKAIAIGSIDSSVGKYTPGGGKFKLWLLGVLCADCGKSRRKKNSRRKHSHMGMSFHNSKY